MATTGENDPNVTAMEEGGNEGDNPSGENDTIALEVENALLDDENAVEDDKVTSEDIKASLEEENALLEDNNTPAENGNSTMEETTEESTVKVEIDIGHDVDLEDEDEEDRHTRTKSERPPPTEEARTLSKKKMAEEEEIDKITAEVLQQLEQDAAETEEEKKRKKKQSEVENVSRPRLSFLRNGLQAARKCKSVHLIPFDKSLLEHGSVRDYMRAATKLYMHTTQTKGDFGWLYMEFGSCQEARECKEQLEDELEDTLVEEGCQETISKLGELIQKKHNDVRGSKEIMPCVLVGHAILDIASPGPASMDELRDEVGQNFPDACSVFVGKRSQRMWCVAVEFPSTEMAHQALKETSTIFVHGEEVKLSVFTVKWPFERKPGDPPEKSRRELKPLLELSGRDDVVKKKLALEISLKKLREKEAKTELEEKRINLLSAEVKKLIKQLESDDTQRSLRDLPALQWKRGLVLKSLSEPSQSSAMSPPSSPKVTKRKSESMGGGDAKRPRTSTTTTSASATATPSSSSSSQTASKRASDRARQLLRTKDSERKKRESERSSRKKSTEKDARGSSHRKEESKRASSSHCHSSKDKQGTSSSDKTKRSSASHSSKKPSSTSHSSSKKPSSSSTTKKSTTETSRSSDSKRSTTSKSKSTTQTSRSSTHKTSTDTKRSTTQGSSRSHTSSSRSVTKPTSPVLSPEAKRRRLKNRPRQRQVQVGAQQKIQVNVSNANVKNSMGQNRGGMGGMGGGGISRGGISRGGVSGNFSDGRRHVQRRNSFEERQFQQEQRDKERRLLQKEQERRLLQEQQERYDQQRIHHHHQPQTPVQPMEDRWYHEPQNPEPWQPQQQQHQHQQQNLPLDRSANGQEAVGFLLGLSNKFNDQLDHQEPVYNRDPGYGRQSPVRGRGQQQNFGNFNSYYNPPY